MCIKYFLHKLDLHAEQLNVITEVRTLVSERVVNLPGFKTRVFPFGGYLESSEKCVEFKGQPAEQGISSFFCQIFCMLIHLEKIIKYGKKIGKK